MECKVENNGKKYCKINGKWILVENKKNAISGSKIKYSSSSSKRAGVC
jgi:hypothetical protein